MLRHLTPYWPPVIGTPVVVPGVSGALSRIIRGGGGGGGATQATVDLHPLYTFIGDSAPGQADGNNVDLKDGPGREVKVSDGDRQRRL